jgi:hypothetical protein
MKRILLFMAVIAVTAAACNSYGKKVKVNDKSEVYYKGDGITEDDAKRLGNYLLSSGYFDSTTEKSVQLSKSADTFNVKFVVDKKKVDAMQNSELIFSLLGMQLSEVVFAKKPVKVILANEYMEGFKDIPAYTFNESDTTVSEPAADSTTISSDTTQSEKLH